MVSHQQTSHGQQGLESLRAQPGDWPISTNAVRENLSMETSNHLTSSSTMTSSLTYLILASVDSLTLLAITHPLPVASWAVPFHT